MYVCEGKQSRATRCNNAWVNQKRKDQLSLSIYLSYRLARPWQLPLNVWCCSFACFWSNLERSASEFSIPTLSTIYIWVWIVDIEFLTQTYSVMYFIDSIIFCLDFFSKIMFTNNHPNWNHIITEFIDCYISFLFNCIRPFFSL